MTGEEGLIVTAIEEVIASLEETLRKIVEATGSTADATSKIDEALTTASTLGTSSTIEELTAVQAALEDLSRSLAGVSSSAERARETAEAVAGDT